MKILHRYIIVIGKFPLNAHFLDIWKMRAFIDFGRKHLRIRIRCCSKRQRKKRKRKVQYLFDYLIIMLLIRMVYIWLHLPGVIFLSLIGFRSSRSDFKHFSFQILWLHQPSCSSTWPFVCRFQHRLVVILVVVIHLIFVFSQQFWFFSFSQHIPLIFFLSLILCLPTIRLISYHKVKSVLFQEHLILVSLQGAGKMVPIKVNQYMQDMSS